jgi:hypothetical protein
MTDKSHRFERVSLLLRRSRSAPRRSKNGVLRHEKRHNMSASRKVQFLRRILFAGKSFKDIVSNSVFH